MINQNKNWMKQAFLYDPAAKAGKTILIIMLITAALFFAGRFIQPQYQQEYSYDEITDMYEGALKRYGGEDFFYYNPLKGAAGNLLNQIVYFTSGIVKEKIEYYKYSGAVLLPFLAAGIFLVVLNFFGLTTAIVSVFVLCLSFWNYYTSGFFLANNLTPVLTVFALYFISKKPLKSAEIVLFIAMTVLCLNSYILWVLAIPLFFYILYERYRGSEEQSEKNGAKQAALALLVTAAAALMVIISSSDSSMFVRFLQVSLVKNKWETAGLLENFRDLGLIFTLPFLNPVEWVFFIWGFVLVLLNLKEQSFRILLFMLIVFSLPMALSGFHHGRSVLMQVPVFIITALGIRQLLTLRAGKYFIFVLIPMCLLPVYHIGRHLTAVNTLSPQDTMDRSIADYLNTAYGDKVSYLEEFEYVYMDDPRKVTIRLKSTYKKKALTEFTAMRFNVYWKKDLEGYFKKHGIKPSMQVFESSVTGRFKKFPSVLAVIPAGSSVEMRMRRHNSDLREIKLKMPWQSGQEIIDNIERYFSASADDIVMNTVLKDLKSDTYIAMGMPQQAVAALLDRKYTSFMPGDFIIRIERIYKNTGIKAQGKEKNE